LTAKLDLDDAMDELKASRELSFETYEGFGEDVSMLEDVAQKVRAILDSARTNGSNLPVDAIEDRVRSVLNLKHELETFIDDISPLVRITDLCAALESIEAADTVPELERMFCH
jgi:archaellum component FlaC